MIYQVETRKIPQVFFEDVNIGDEIPSINRGPYTAIKTALFIGALWVDFFPAHYCGAWARRMGCPGIYLHGHQITALLSQVVTDWIGPNGALKKFSTRMVSDAFARYTSQIPDDIYEGDTLTAKGRVFKTRLNWSLLSIRILKESPAFPSWQAMKLPASETR